METQLFDVNDGWDQSDTMAFGFFDVTLKQAIGPYPIGEKFISAWLDYGEGTIKLYKNKSEPACFTGKLILTVSHD